MKSVQTTIYNLPNVLKAVREGKFVFLVEGEKDCENLAELGFVSSTAPAGAGKWKSCYNKYFKNAKVCILPDCDQVGRDHGIQVAQSLCGVADTIRILNLPGLGEKEDVTDWIDRGGTADELKKLVLNCELWKPEDAPESVGNGQVAQENTDKTNNFQFEATDSWNAKHLQENFGSKIRYNNTIESFFVWDGSRWLLDESKLIRRFAKENAILIEKLTRDAPKFPDGQSNEDLCKSIKTWAKKSKQRWGIVNAIELVKDLDGISKIQSDFDNDPLLFNCRNGTVDLKTGNFREHRKSDHLTKRSEVIFDEKATCPFWDESLKMIFNDDTELIRFVRQIMGYCLSGITDEEVVFFAHGKGKNGKSRFFDVLEMLTGDYFLKTHAELFMINSNQSINLYYMATLPGVRIAVASEVSNASAFNESVLKDLSGGDTISARPAYGKPFNFSPTHKIFLYGNSEPRVKATDEGFWRRIRKIPFTVEIPDSKRKPKSELIEIYKNELSGILNFALGGWQDYQDCGSLILPASVAAATREYRESSDTVGIFKEECLAEKIGAETTVKIIYTAYDEWCKECNERPLKKRAFNKRLMEHNVEVPFKGAGNVLKWKNLVLID